MLTFQVLLFAFIGGVIPTLFWLWFWLREDATHPEPRHLIIASFILGMLMVPIAIPLEQWVSSLTAIPLLIFLGWALVEEVLKYISAYLGGMHTQAEDEPIDAMIYLITAALGFAAFENTLFLLDPLLEGEAFIGIITQNIRFIGPTLLHILSSAIIGGAIALSFYRKERVKIEYFLGGLILAVGLHTIFNSLIMKLNGSGIFVVFAFVWVAIIGLLLFFEKVKRATRNKQRT